VYTDLPLERIAAIEERLSSEPLACKRLLAHEIVRRYHGAAVADEEQAWFIATFSARQAPSDMPELCVAPGVYPALELVRHHFGAQLGAQRSTSDLRRLFRQRAITLDGAATITQPDEPITARDGAVFQVGKRVWFRLRVAPSSSPATGDDRAG
jgi:tyrosyl-tRNA synthetase